jgi:hypothetical protein
LGQTRVTTQKGHNVLSSPWIALKFLQEFVEFVFLGVAKELLHYDEEV